LVKALSEEQGKYVRWCYLIWKKNISANFLLDGLVMLDVLPLDFFGLM
jgi:hypothetical protein